jgi:hypothetical protein
LAAAKLPGASLTILVRLQTKIAESLPLLVRFLLTKIEQEQRRFDPAGALATAQNWLRTLTYGEAQSWMSRWLDVTPETIVQHLHAIWDLQEREETLNTESKLFIHPFFWAPYMLIGEPTPHERKAD